jgi:hypothetical protein
MLNVPSKSNKQKNFEEKKQFFVAILKATDKKSRIRIRKSVVRISGSGSGSVPKCHGFHNTGCGKHFIVGCFQAWGSVASRWWELSTLCTKLWVLAIQTILPRR